MSTFVQDSDKNCKKLYKWVDDILEGQGMSDGNTWCALLFYIFSEWG